MSGSSELAYPNLANCRVTLTGSVTATSKSPVHLPNDILSSTKMKLKDEPFDFSLERKVLQRKDDWDTIKSASSREELQKNVVVRMKSVTGAKDDICISMLESNGYDLKTSIETFFNRR